MIRHIILSWQRVSCLLIDTLDHAISRVLCWLFGSVECRIAWNKFQPLFTVNCRATWRETETGRLFVANGDTARILLNSCLELVRVLVDKEHSPLTWSPCRMCYVQQAAQLCKLAVIHSAACSRSEFYWPIIIVGLADVESHCGHPPWLRIHGLCEVFKLFTLPTFCSELYCLFEWFCTVDTTQPVGLVSSTPHGCHDCHRYHPRARVALKNQVAEIENITWDADCNAYDESAHSAYPALS